MEEPRRASERRQEMTSSATVQVLPNPAVEPWWRPVWDRHHSRYCVPASAKPADESGLRRELVFCLLGGHGVTYELASSATEAVMALHPFGTLWTRAKLRRSIHHELTRPQFEPRRSNGTPRRYRYPSRKATLLSDAVFWVHDQGGLLKGLSVRLTESERREWLCTCPGVGLKTASWLLRNCGWARELAILDVHLVRALSEAGVIIDAQLPRDYLRIERAYLDWAEHLGACPAALDLFLWDVQRTSRTAR